MPDLNDDLFSSFKNEGSPVTPLPASEVRRRGDRMRRRNNTLAAVGGVAAALVVIATPLAVVANQSTDSSRPDVAGRQTTFEWLQEIPDTVDASVGIQGQDASQDPESTDEPGVATVEMCGEAAFDANDGTVDLAGATYEPAEATDDAGDARTLALYADDKAAAAAVDALRSAAAGCASEPFGAGGDTTDTEIVPATIDADESFLIARSLVRKGTDYAESITYYVVARTGNAVLVTIDPGTPPNDQQVDDEQDRVADLVDQMQVFSEANAMRVDTDSEADLGTSIPDDFDLVAGFPEDSAAARPAFGRETGRELADPASYGPGPEACGTTPTGLPTPTDTLYGGWRNPDGGQLRTLMTFASEDEAQAYADAVMAIYADCPEETDAQGVTTVFGRSEEPGVGDYAASLVRRFEVEGQPGPGHQVVQVVRVGSALLLFDASYDEAEPVDPATGAAELTTTYLNANSPVIDAM